MSVDTISILTTLLMVLLIVAVVFLVCREFFCWYFKINKIVELLKIISQK